MAFLEVPREQRKPHQQAEQVGEHHPFRAEVTDETGDAEPLVKAGERELVEHDDREASERDFERAVMQQRHAQQRQREQDELERNAERLETGAGRKRCSQTPLPGTSTRSSSRRPSPPVRRRSTKSKRSTSVQ